MNTTVSLRNVLQNNTIPAAPELAWKEGDAIRCVACGHRCLINPGRAGVCRVRFNDDGELKTPGGYVAGLQVDPIEKKPFYHAYPGRDALSFGMLGCDFHCSYCQNWVTSQALRDDAAVAMPTFCAPQEMVDIAIQRGAPVVVSTYNEPLITSEWAVAVFKVARQRGLTCGYVSNGNATPEVLKFLRPYVDLYKVDLKGFDDKHYRELGGVLANVLTTIDMLIDMKFWVEIVTLVVPGFNDSDKELGNIARFLADISTDMPWHVTAFRPDYKMQDRGSTPGETLLRAYEIGRAAGLKHVYPGNHHGRVGDRECTKCPKCESIVIRRKGFYVEENRMTEPGKCPDCGGAIAGVWEANPPKRSTGSGIPMSVL